MISSAFKRTVAGTSRPQIRGRRTISDSRHRRTVALASFGVLGAGVLAAGDARGEGVPPRATQHYLQYGVGLATETVAAAGQVCPSDGSAPCILGSGLGLALRIGYRTRGPFYVGGAYEFSGQDSSNLLRLAILQQLRGEARYYLLEDTRLVPYVAAAAGGVLYGNEWGVDTGGLSAFLGAGAEFQISRTSVFGVVAGYRPLVLHRWEDGAGQLRADQLFGFGVAHVVTLEVVFEVRDPLSRW